MKGSHRHDHKFLNIDGCIGMRATIEYIHHRHGQYLGIGSKGIYRGVRRPELQHGRLWMHQVWRWHQARICWSPVQLEHGTVNCALSVASNPTNTSNLLIHIIHSLRNTLAKVVAIVAITHDRFVLPVLAPEGTAARPKLLNLIQPLLTVGCVPINDFSSVYFNDVCHGFKNC